MLKEQQSRDGSNLGVDLILKEHDPPHSNACRLLGRILEDEVLRTIPVVGEPPRAHYIMLCFDVWGRGRARLPPATRYLQFVPLLARQAFTSAGTSGDVLGVEPRRDSL